MQAFLRKIIVLRVKKFLSPDLRPIQGILQFVNLWRRDMTAD